MVLTSSYDTSYQKHSDTEPSLSRTRLRNRTKYNLVFNECLILIGQNGNNLYIMGGQKNTLISEILLTGYFGSTASKSYNYCPLGQELNGFHAVEQSYRENKFTNSDIFVEPPFNSCVVFKGHIHLK